MHWRQLESKALQLSHVTMIRSLTPVVLSELPAAQHVGKVAHQSLKVSSGISQMNLQMECITHALSNFCTFAQASEGQFHSLQSNGSKEAEDCHAPAGGEGGRWHCAF